MEPIEPFPSRSVCTAGDKREAESGDKGRGGWRECLPAWHQHTTTDLSSSSPSLHRLPLRGRKPALGRILSWSAAPSSSVGVTTRTAIPVRHHRGRLCAPNIRGRDRCGSRGSFVWLGYVYPRLGWKVFCNPRGRSPRGLFIAGDAPRCSSLVTTCPHLFMRLLSK